MMLWYALTSQEVMIIYQLNRYILLIQVTLNHHNEQQSKFIQHPWTQNENEIDFNSLIIRFKVSQMNSY
jgi:hypothetical protein